LSRTRGSLKAKGGKEVPPVSYKCDASCKLATTSDAAQNANTQKDGGGGDASKKGEGQRITCQVKKKREKKRDA